MRLPLAAVSLLILFTFLSCGSNTELDNLNQSKETIDSTIQLRINNHLQPFKIKKGSQLNFEDFQKFLDDYSNKPLMFNDTQRVDVTGDGKKENVIRIVKMINNTCIIYAGIYEANKLIYADTLDLHDEYNFMAWENDSVYFTLKPYSCFYEAWGNMSILDSLDPKYPGYEYWIEMYLATNESEYKRLGLDSLTISAKKDSIKNELDHFQGKLVFKMDQMDREILIWNRNKQQFENFYSP